MAGELQISRFPECRAGREHRMAQEGLGQYGSGEPRPVEDCETEVGPVQVSGGKIGARQDRPGERRSDEARGAEVRVTQVGFREVSPVEPAAG